LDKALHQHKDPTTRYGKLVARLNQIAAMPYEELCDAGYLDTDRKQMVAARRSVLVEEIGEEEMNALLSDVQRIHRVFPDAGAKFRTKLPLTRGSEGFNVRQDYILKHFLPAQSLCSIYGPSGSYKSFLAVSWACHIAAGLSWAGKKVTPGAVLYVVGEGAWVFPGVYGHGSRCMAYRQTTSGWSIARCSLCVSQRLPKCLLPGRLKPNVAYRFAWW
jgi:hypothetical protein